MKQTKVGAVMTTDVVRARHDTPFKEVARLLADHRISGLPVVDDEEHVVGVVSETDLMVHQAQTPDGWEPPARTFRLPSMTPAARRYAARARARTAGGLMTTTPVTVHAEDSVVQAARTMVRRHVDRLPVVDEEDRLVGIVTRHDLLRVFLRTDEGLREEVVREVLGRGLWLSPQSVEVRVDQGVVTLRGVLDRRSEAEAAVSMTRRIDGVVAVVDELGHRTDDTRTEPERATVHGVADDWLHRL
ncbi:CBS domain-containing protein [Streptomyces fragilis]|uniref:CBS domain-containing protein n=1 Tax=Streptomyces fragilis TaxID=67301 RepID=A0ABV2YI60_9ACTN|nr:CBS domain-containing protein [Streptomyces fragilis]